MQNTTYSKNTPGPLHSKTLELLRNRPRTLTLEIIEAETKIDKDWLAKFGQGQIGDPSVNRVEVLKNYLLTKIG